MKTKLLFKLTILVVGLIVSSCKTELDTTEPNRLPEDIVYTDPALIESVLANLYNSVNYGQNNGDYTTYQLLDEANNNYGAATTTNDENVVPRNFYRIRDYGLVRRMNLFIRGINTPAAIDAIPASTRLNYEAQARFLRAWYYFCSARSLGGMPIIEDVYTYDPSVPIEELQVPRSTEAETYQYVMKQCDIAAKDLTRGKTQNAAIANYWTAKMLKARAAVYAASIAKYGNLRTPNLHTENWEAGIPASMAEQFYKIAYQTADSIVKFSPYAFQKDPANPGLAFYRATSVKSGNTEVIWALDRLKPTVNTAYTNFVMPYSHRDYTEGNALGAVLNLVEAFENIDNSDPTIKVKNPDGSYVFYDSPEKPFLAKDARLWGTVIWPNAPYRNTPVLLQAGQLNKNSAGNWVLNAGAAGSTANGDVLTSINGPISNTGNYVNKTGFGVRKFLDEAANAGLNPTFSDMWMPRFRIAEAHLIAAEAALELNDKTNAVKYINNVRSRGGIQELTAANITFDHIVNENRVEFAFEDHRYWDLKRWRLAHTVWNGVLNNPTAQLYSLYPYKVVSAGDPNNGKWVFTKQVAYKRATTPLNFPIGNYYATIDAGWITRNPKLVPNPQQ